MATTLKTDCNAEVAPEISPHDMLVLHCESVFDGDDYEELLLRILGHYKHDQATLEILGQIMDDYVNENYNGIFNL
jgi:hypothetical protein